MENKGGKELLDELERLLKRKENNDRATTPEERSGKYKKSYTAQKQEICNVLIKLIPQVAIGGLTFLEEDKQEMEKFKKKAMAIIERENQSGYIPEIAKVAFTTYSLEKTMDAMARLQNMVTYEAYAEYWLSKCEPVNVCEYIYYNPIIDMYYSQNDGYWHSITDGGKYKKESIRSEFPPTKALMEKEYKNLSYN